MEIRCLKSTFDVTDSEGREMPAMQTAKVICRCWQKVSLGQCSAVGPTPMNPHKLSTGQQEFELDALGKPAFDSM